MKKLLLALTIFALVIGVSGIDAANKKAPGIALEDINGQFTMLSSLLSKNNLVISFWSYDCVPCRKEMPELNEMAKSELFKQKNVRVIFVYVEAKTEKSKKGSESMTPKDKALEVLNQFGVNELCLMDIYGVAFNNYRKATGVKNTTLPLTYLLNQNQQIVFKAIGFNEKNLKSLEKAIEKKL